MLRVSGLESITRLQRRIGRSVAEDALARAIAPEVRSALFDAYQSDFSGAHAPDGKRWRGHKRPLGNPIGVRTSRLATPRVTVRRLASGLAIRIFSPEKYAVFFHRRRAIVPLTDSLEKWAPEVEQAADRGLSRIAGSVR